MSSTIHTDCLVVGGGLAGATTALEMHRLGLKVVLLDSGTPESYLDKGFDGRVSALAYSTVSLLQTIGVWDSIASHAEPILDIRITDGNSPHFLHFPHNAVSDQPMGYIVENRYIRQGLYEALSKIPAIHFYTESTLTQLHEENGLIHAQAKGKAPLHITSALVIGADGKNSSVRRMRGITHDSKPYTQSAIVCTIHHEKPHHSVAVERFLPVGPFAILPMKGGHHSSLVWTEDSTTIEAFLKLDDAAFNAEILKRTTDYLGAVEAVGPRFFYPLALQHATEMVAPRTALLGDAAHVIHPVAGQGLNLGFRDLEALSAIISEAFLLGLDIGSDSVLSRYAQARRRDNALMAFATDGLVTLFSNDNTLLKTGRRLGLTAVEHLPILKRMFISHAMGRKP